MKIIVKLLTILFLFLSQISLAQHSIIPEPVSYESAGGALIINKTLNVNLLSPNDTVSKQLEVFKEYFSLLDIVFSAQTVDSTSTNGLTIGLNEVPDEELGIEGYQLLVEEGGMVLMANASAGVFNGLQTIKQLFPAKRVLSAEGEPEPISIETCIIKDYPRFGWRGLMLDVSRHFFSVEDVKAYLDQMAAYKLNVFHWHLTDDEGWRIEIKTFPKLTEVGAWRAERYGNQSWPTADGIPRHKLVDLFSRPGEQSTGVVCRYPLARRPALPV